MRTPGTLRRLMLAPLIAAAFTAGTAFAQINVSISLAPPAPQYELVPTIPMGYVWAPGYWAWTGDRHIWIRGRQIVERPGYRWDPDRWDQRDGHYIRSVGHWAQDPGYRKVKVKKDKHNGHGKGHGKGHDRHG